MEAPIIVAIITSTVSLVAAGLLYKTNSETRAENRRKERAEAAAKARAKTDEDTTTIRIKKLESVDEFRGELLNLWRESRDGWAKCERDRNEDKAEAAKVAHEQDRKIGLLENELRTLKKGLGDAVRPSLPPPAPA